MKQLDENLRKLEKYYDTLNKSKNAFVEVGVISHKLTKKIYKNNVSVTEVAATHEYGTAHIPRRSFLRMPFKMKNKEIDVFIKKEYQAIFEGRSNVKKSLGLIGAYARNISLEAFETGGFGTWTPLSPATIAAKGTATILVETATLKNSISWEVKGVSS